MDDIFKVLKALAAIGFGAVATLVLFIYVAYGLQNDGCWKPMGCIDPKQVAEQHENDRILESWRHFDHK